jgi:hypothetical protein
MYNNMSLAPVSGVTDYYKSGSKINYKSESRLDEMFIYDENTPYKLDYVVNTDVYENYKNESISGVSKIFSMVTNNTGYTFDVNNDSLLGTNNQTSGLRYIDNGENITFFDTDVNINVTKKLSNIMYNSEGWNNTNIILSGLMKDEKYFGIIDKPKTESDIFIERGQVSVLESHLRLSEIRNVEEFDRYNFNNYNVVKQIL